MATSGRSVEAVATELPTAGSVLAVCAHPDDESFGLGATLARFAGLGGSVSVLCFTHGEGSTLGAVPGVDLGAVRSGELTAAAEVLGVRQVRLLDHPDGGLISRPVGELAGDVEQMALRTGADLLVTFDEGGITGHPDHVAATRAALLAARRMGLPVLAWALEETVADELNDEFGASFVGRPTGEVDFRVHVDRQVQRRAIACHQSQDVGNAVLRKRLGAQGDGEVYRWLRPPPRLGVQAGPAS